MFIDSCWLPALSPTFFRNALRDWLSFVPINKIMLGHDATTIEMAVGSSMTTRKILADALMDIGADAGLTPDDMRDKAAALLQNNAVRMYGTGEHYTP
jgi:hypothetical protein